MTLMPDDLPDDAETLKAMILAARAEAAVLRADKERLDAERARLAHEGQVLAAEVDRLTAQNERLDHIVSVLRRAQFGRRSEKISDDQIELALEDVETAFGAEDAATEETEPIARREGTEARRANRGHLPKHLPREEVVIAPAETSCPCCGGDLHVIGEDVSERLDKVPAKLRVIVTRRPKYACRSCEKTGADGADGDGHPKRPRETAGVIQAPAPARLIPGGLPTEALVADVLVSKYADHLPLYRQAQILAREGLHLNRSTLAHWVGFAAYELNPLHARLVEILKASGKLFADETRCPVLDPGRGKTKTGYLWAIARDDRPWGGTDPPGVAYIYAPGRGAEHAVRSLAGFAGVLQVDGYAAYDALADTKRTNAPVRLALCWSHFRRRFYEITKSGNAPIASEALARIGALYTIETEIRGRSAEERRAVRQQRTRPLMNELYEWLEEQLRRVPGRSPLAGAMRYGVRHREGLGQFLHDGRVEIDTNVVERTIRPIALNRKNALFAGSDEGGANWATIASLIETAKLNRVNPHAWLTDTLTKLVNGWPQSRIDDLMPWAYPNRPA
jgi:transposase